MHLGDICVGQMCWRAGRWAGCARSSVCWAAENSRNIVTGVCEKNAHPLEACSRTHTPHPPKCNVEGCLGGDSGPAKKTPTFRVGPQAAHHQHCISGCGGSVQTPLLCFRMGVFFADTGIKWALISQTIRRRRSAIAYIEIDAQCFMPPFPTLWL